MAEDTQAQWECGNADSMDTEVTKNVPETQQVFNENTEECRGEYSSAFFRLSR